MRSSVVVSAAIALLSRAVSAQEGPGTTLQEGFYWIRAVAAPNFHKYLQTDPLYTTGDALMEDYTTAGQWQIIDGQLVELVSAPGEPEEYLYANVAEESDVYPNTLAVTVNETENTYGTFSWNGDAVMWSAPDLNRPNNAAWYVCEGQRLFVNLGNYLDPNNTPSGCADQTIHYYNAATAND
ncbi:hypothetical protein BDY21DRAFT_369494 [Lineolata rhizophorae]|uniref:Uncharacterized protein n=1 Tax=Lineolata rhizophorae TaxID=578093 RepID=A0A6A6P9D0_9PEZI|nr:hypothetical protein BDY21DRAFT_369494 [Lineolata rhizophorae]